MRPDVALAFDRMAAAAREEAGLFLSVTSGFRSDAEQAILFAAHPDPKWVAPPGESLHRYATELDLGPPGAYAWLSANATRFGFLMRYSWEPWHYGLPLAHKSLATCVGSRTAPEGWPCGGLRTRPLYPPRHLMRKPQSVGESIALIREEHSRWRHHRFVAKGVTCLVGARVTAWRRLDSPAPFGVGVTAFRPEESRRGRRWTRLRSSQASTSRASLRTSGSRANRRPLDELSPNAEGPLVREVLGTSASAPLDRRARRDRTPPFACRVGHTYRRV
jgi:hypothetical protein